MTNNVQTPGGNTTTAVAVEQLARRIAADVIAKEGMTSIAEQIRRGNRDGLDTVKAALAAIIDTQEWAAGIAEAERLRHDTGDGFDSQPCRNTAWRIREAIREGTNQ